jgi:hypothetical protein
MDEIARMLESGAIGGVVSIGLEKIPWFQNLSSATKFWVAIVATVGTTLGIRAALIYVPPEVWEVLSPWINVVTTSVLGSQVIHRLVNKDTTVVVERYPDDVRQ